MLNKIKNHINLPIKIVAGLFLSYLLFSYFAINPLAKRIVPWLAENKLASKASVGKVAFDPFRLKTTIENFNLSEKSDVPLAAFEKLVVDFELSGLFDWAWKFKEISITAPQANIAISNKGKLNWASLIAKLNEDKTPSDNTIPRVVIGLISIKQGNFQYEDANRPTPFKADLTPLNFQLDGFSTLPKDRGDYLVAAKLSENGGALKWKGDLGVNPVASKGHVAFSNIQLTKLMQAIKGVDLPFKPADGAIQASFSYDFSLPKNQPQISLNKIAITLNNLAGAVAPAGILSLKQVAATLPRLDFSMQDKPQLTFQDLNLKLTDLNIKNNQEKHSVVLLSLPQLDVNKVNFDLAARKATVAQVLLMNGTINATRNKAGLVNWQQALVGHDGGTKQASSVPENKSVQPPEAPFTLAINDFQLQHWLASYEDQAFVNPLKVNVADINLGFAFSMPEGNVEVSRLQSNIVGLTAKSTLYNTPVITLDKLNLSEGQISLVNQKVDVQSILLSGLKTQLIKEANKPINWVEILKSVPSTSSKVSVESNNQSKKTDWTLSLKKMALDNASVHVEDRSLETPVTLDIEKAAIEMQDTSLDLSKPLPVKAAFQVKQGGQFTALGKLTPSPLKADLNIKLTQLMLKPFGPYVNQFALLKLNSGNTEVAGKLLIKEDKTLAVNFKGGFSVNKLSLVEEANDAPFLGWERVSSDSLTVSLSPDRVHMTQLQIVKPIGKFIIHEDKSMNITRILRNQSSSTTSSATSIPSQPALKSAQQPIEVVKNTDIAKPTLVLGASTPQIKREKTMEKPSVPMNNKTPQTESFPVSIDTVRVDNAELDFADLSLIPQFGTHINSLTGVINGVSTSATSVAQVELDGKVDDYGSARVRGSIQPFDATNFTDIALSFKNVDMNRLTPYSGKFAGRRIDSGKLSVDLEYKIKQRQLAGENKFIINKLKLGETVDSAEAANLPLDLAIAILEDSNGVIDLDLPISGSLDDPQFSYGNIVWKAIKNVLTKIVTSPFRALGKLFGAGAEKLESITFDAGSAALAPPEQEKIITIAQALNKRSGLALGVAPSYDDLVDARALQETSLRRQVALEMGVDIANNQLAGPIDLANPKTQKAVDALYDKLTKKSFLKKMAAKLEKPKVGHYEEALEKLTASIEITEPDLQALAKSRGKVIQKALVSAGIAEDRTRVDAPIKINANSKTINTKLSLDVKDAKNNAAEPVTN